MVSPKDADGEEKEGKGLRFKNLISPNKPLEPIQEESKVEESKEPQAHQEQ